MSACGTNNGYQHHRKRGEVACGPCLEAHATYMRDYRAKTRDTAAPRFRGEQAPRKRALWNAAVRRLIDENPERFDELMVEVELSVWMGQR